MFFILDFTSKSGVIHSEVFLPEDAGAPERLLDRAALWNEVERVEVRRDAQLAREIELSIPREMSGWRSLDSICGSIELVEATGADILSRALGF